MADYYTEGASRTKRKSTKVHTGKELSLLIVDIVVTILMSGLIFTSFAAMFCQYISPVKSGVLSVLALGAPIIYLLNIVVMLYWVIRLRWYHALTMFVVVFIGLFYLPKYYKLEIDRKYETSFKERKYTKVMTYNVFEGRKEGFVEYIKKHNPDILCVQEMTIGCDNWNALTEDYQSTYVPNVAIGGTQILTKYKIIRSGEIGDLPRHTANWADLKIKEDTVRVVNLHLHSTSIKAEDTNFLETHKYILDKERDTKLRSIIGRLVENNQKRAEQAQLVSDFLKESPYKVIVCGDFNDIPLSYTYRTIARKLDDAFSEMADGFAYTYNTRYKLLRIDNILVSPSIEVASYEVDNAVNLSDHYPVISRLVIQPQ